MWNAGLDEAQAGIKIAGRNIKKLTYVVDTTLMTESKDELKSFFLSFFLFLKSLLMKMKEETEKVVLKLNIQKTKITESSPITS